MLRLPHETLWWKCSSGSTHWLAHTPKFFPPKLHVQCARSCSHKRDTKSLHSRTFHVPKVWTISGMRYARAIEPLSIRRWMAWWSQTSTSWPGPILSDCIYIKTTWLHHLHHPSSFPVILQPLLHLRSGTHLVMLFYGSFTTTYSWCVCKNTLLKKKLVSIYSLKE